ncbi:methyltransferase domain-containing protein [Archangium violaceum]|uniref:SAM-dependent methyltransferase n=1 Tax=Archangium violaceum TaxID=83451 RepID=UPI002B27F3E4|nr:methyltransferase domain-containing protein [Archangium gephyra]
MSRNVSLEEQVATALETTPELLPFMPELLADLDELGTEVRDIIELLRPLGLSAGARVLDLGCGKGTVALALARELGPRVLGVDGFTPFVEEAKRRAEERGLSGLCEFRQGDLREAVAEVEGVDVVMLLAVGRVLGDAAETVGALRRCVRPGGYMVINDGYVAEGVALESSEDLKGYAHLEETRRRMQSHGDRLVGEELPSTEETDAYNASNTELIRRRAEALALRHPEAAERVRGFVAEQERQSRLLTTDLLNALWLLRRGP